jgi:hypothetical protein
MPGGQKLRSGLDHFGCVSEAELTAYSALGLHNPDERRQKRGRGDRSDYFPSSGGFRGITGKTVARLQSCAYFTLTGISVPIVDYTELECKSLITRSSTQA